MIRKGKSLLFGRISRTFFFKNGGSGGGTAENPHLPPNLFPFLAELDNFEIFLEKSWSNLEKLEKFFGGGWRYRRRFF